ncbi:hypothetical protein CCUS01_02889 [Colletotrichum cuscutae]|uniref:Uncharacterized protein n=1 Tax=Colletotrichum cuscutae TaxID=1209917 RepID=A0AAI9YAL2_9PEZI|nr:hypothetical protein CCUS01_02889 [Colletotrichum cuscutae]
MASFVSQVMSFEPRRLYNEVLPPAKDFSSFTSQTIPSISIPHTCSQPSLRMSGATVVDLTHLGDESTDWSTSDSESPNDEPQLIHSNQPSQPSQPNEANEANEHINDRDSEVTNEPSINRDNEHTAHLIPCSPSNMVRPAKKKATQRPPLNLSGLSNSSPVPSGSASSSKSNKKKATAPKSANVTKNTGASKPNNSTKRASVSQPANAKENPSVVSSAKNTKQTNQSQLSDPDQVPEVVATEGVEASDKIAMRTKIQQLIEALKNVNGIQHAITDEMMSDIQDLIDVPLFPTTTGWVSCTVYRSIQDQSKGEVGISESTLWAAAIRCVALEQSINNNGSLKGRNDIRKVLASMEDVIYNIFRPENGEQIDIQAQVEPFTPMPDWLICQSPNSIKMKKQSGKSTSNLEPSGENDKESNELQQPDESELDDQENENDTTEHQQAYDDHANHDNRLIRAGSTDIRNILAARRWMGQGRPSTTPPIKHNVPILNRPEKRPREESVTSTVSDLFHKRKRLLRGESEISVNTPSEIAESPGRPQSTNSSARNIRPQTNQQTLHFDKEGSYEALKAENQDIYKDDIIAPQSGTTTTTGFKQTALRLFDEDSEDSEEEKPWESTEKTDTDRRPRPLTGAEQVEAKLRIVNALKGLPFRQRAEVLFESVIGLIMEMGVDPSGRIEECVADLSNN